MNTKNSPIKFSIAFISFLLTTVVLIAQPASADSIIQVKRTQDFEVKGDGTAANWNKAEWITLTHSRGTPRSYDTKAKILYSESGIYCLFKCNDAKITATLKEDFLDLYNEDVVEVFFWTDEKVPIYFEYELSPLNFELPILVPNIKGEFLGWRPWHYEGERKTRHAAYIDKGKSGDTVLSWTAEFFIPFALLKPMSNVPPQKGTRWRANFYRLDYDNGTAGWTWRPIRKNFHDFEKFGTIVFE
jgi:Carbohydrate family 9 binding domain-like